MSRQSTYNTVDTFVNRVIKLTRLKVHFVVIFLVVPGIKSNLKYTIYTISVDLYAECYVRGQCVEEEGA